jgi:thymidylate synthase ThyX
MSDGQRDKQFWELADSFIQLANTHLNEVKPSKISASALFAASRFNAFVITASASSKEQLIAEKEAAIAYFLEQYETMLRENLDEHLARYDQHIGQ